MQNKTPQGVLFFVVGEFDLIGRMTYCAVGEGLF